MHLNPAGVCGAAAQELEVAARAAQVTEMYRNCIKLAAENKISQKNTWSLNLIDHMSDLVKPSDEGRTTNFQNASCTLDAGIKIYSYRVDSVHSEAFKVLGGLSRSAGAVADDADAAIDNGGQGVLLEAALCLLGCCILCTLPALSTASKTRFRAVPTVIVRLCRRQMRARGSRARVARAGGGGPMQMPTRAAHWRTASTLSTSRSLIWHSQWTRCSTRCQRSLTRAVPQVPPAQSGAVSISLLLWEGHSCCAVVHMTLCLSHKLTTCIAAEQVCC
jgi:Condensin complex subunit 2